MRELTPAQATLRSPRTTLPQKAKQKVCLQNSLPRRTMILLQRRIGATTTTSVSGFIFASTSLEAHLTAPAGKMSSHVFFMKTFLIEN